MNLDHRPLNDMPAAERADRADPLALLLGRLRQRLWLQAILTSLSLAVVVLALSYQVVGTPLPLLGIAAALLMLVLDYVRYRPLRWSTATFAHYLNRRVPDLEESAGLWLQPESSLTMLQRLQRRRVAHVWDELPQSPQRWLPALNPRAALGVTGVGVVMGLTYAVATILYGPTNVSVAPADSLHAQGSQLINPSLVAIDIEPPPYTQLPALRVTQADVNVPEGSTVRWHYQGPELVDWQLVLSDAARQDRRLNLQPSTKEPSSHADAPSNSAAGGAIASASATVDATSLYYLEPLVGQTGEDRIPAVHSIAVTLDQPPTIRVDTPESTRVEIAKDGAPQFQYGVTIGDDYGITEVEIRVSVAKGSGEGVKFRDARYPFERSQPVDDGFMYEQQWDLRELGMAPGDELYLFTRAYDNHPGQPQSSRSDTVVVRWLDEAPEVVGEDGLAISVMPEYFKSQRQIIIETEQLLADRSNLSHEVFLATSRALGVDQGELKERYGQYVGDEFGESEAPEGLTEVAGNSAGASIDSDSGHEHEDHEGHDHGADGGDHGAGGTGGTDSLFGNAEALMARFGHDHGAADIGPISRQSPVGLMKRALANMWDAELHLRLGDPETALPFERDALRYFDLARKAQRIYTQRLGFEPPPISEDRRLTGDLADIQSRVYAQQAVPDSSTTAVLQDVHRWLLSTPDNTEFSDSDRDLLQAGATVLTEAAESRPGFIRAAALLTQLHRQGRMNFGDCSDCRQVLRQTLWSALPTLVAPVSSAPRAMPSSLAERYGQRLQQLRQGPG